MPTLDEVRAAGVRKITWDELGALAHEFVGGEMVLEDDDTGDLRGPIQTITASPGGVDIALAWNARYTARGWQLVEGRIAPGLSFGWEAAPEMVQVCSDGCVRFRVRFNGDVTLYPPGVMEPLSRDDVLG